MLVIIFMICPHLAHDDPIVSPIAAI
jgi:hypothetical protein